jgi:hypothetical protein
MSGSGMQAGYLEIDQSAHGAVLPASILPEHMLTVQRCASQAYNAIHVFASGCNLELSGSCCTSHALCICNRRQVL